MPLFQTNAFATPFGRNVYLRSTQDIKTTSWTFAAATMPARTIDTFTGQKVLQPGMVVARITSGPDTGKVGPAQLLVTDGRQTLTNIVGICNTFLPWQLMEGDREIAVVYEAAVIQAQCLELDAAGLEVALTDLTAAAMFGKKHIDIRFH